MSPGHAGLFGSALPGMAEVNLTIVQTTVDFAMHACSAKSSISELPHFAVSRHQPQFHIHFSSAAFVPWHSSLPAAFS